MRATIDGITYEGTPEEIREIVENPPNQPPVRINTNPPGWDWWRDSSKDFPRNWDGSPIVTCLSNDIFSDMGLD